jgi:cytosine/adenosine deaminase-related metal-dependent hydrolase
VSDTKLVRGRWIVTAAGALSDSAIKVDDGAIAEIGDWESLRARHPDATVIGSDRFAVLPGLINAHHHSSAVSVLQQGIPDQLLEPWLLSLSLCRPVDQRLTTLLSAGRLLRSGITTVVDVHSDSGSVDAYEANARAALTAYDTAGIRVAFALSLMTQCFLVAGAGEDERFLGTLPDDLRGFASRRIPAAGSISEAEYFGVVGDLWRKYRSHPRIDVWFAPPGPQWVSDSFMMRIAEQAESYDTGMQTHVTESIYEMLHGPRFYRKPTLHHLRELGVLSPRFSIAHGVWLTEPEIDIVAETGAAVCHNPSSNLRLRAGIAPLNEFLARGATVALGMDGTTLNDDEDFFTEMRLAMRLHRTPQFGGPAPTPAQIFALATSGGARLMRKESVLGTIAPGYAADLVLVDLERVTWPWIAPESDPRDLLLMRAGAGDVDTVLVGGEVVLRGGRPTRFDMEEVGREAAAVLGAASYPIEDAQLIERLLPHVEAYYQAWDIPELAPYTAYNTRR